MLMIIISLLSYTILLIFINNFYDFYISKER
nr:MAG TPA: hypothetical protein [Caudoviricetes sp.]